MRAIEFDLWLEEPLLVTQANSQEPNSSISHTYIPGGVIRGALIGQYIKKHKVADLASDSQGYDLFLSGKVRYLNGYLLHQERLLPKPMSWLVEKGQESETNIELCDFATGEEFSQLERPKPPTGEFVYYSNQHVWLKTPSKQVNVHNASIEPGRKAAAISQVYRYDALAAKQTFRAVILADDNIDITRLTPFLGDAYFALGRSSTSGYGLVAVSNIREHSNWQEYKEETPLDHFHIITCLSDLILRDSRGQLSASLSRTLNLSAEDVTAFQKLRLVGGFNNKWGLPLPQAMAVKAGSVFRIKKEAIPEDKLRKYVQRGIGERTAEGYGRIALNLHTQSTRIRTNSPKAVPKMSQPLSNSSRMLAQKMAQRQLRQRLEKELNNIVLSHLDFARLPSTTQLSRVRLVARQSLAKNDLSLIVSHMDNMKGAKRSWEKAKVNDSYLFNWIKQQCKLDNQKFSQLFNIANKCPIVAGETSQINDLLETEFRARLIDGVMKQAVLKQQTVAKQSTKGSA